MINMRCVTNGRLVALLLALGGALGPAATAEAAVPQKNAQPPTSTLQEGDGGGAVLALNRRLFSLHFLPSVGGDTYGAATTDGVIAFQKWVGLPRDGVERTAKLKRVWRKRQSRHRYCHKAANGWRFQFHGRSDLR